MQAAISANTVMVVGSAPAFPHGVFDPIADIAAMARKRHLWMHVDACVGGFLAPFAVRLGYPIPAFDFALDGVCSMSADLHKYGFTAKGASVVLFASESWRQHLVFEFDKWPRGKYSASTFGGSRPGGAIAAAWAVMRYLGIEGYVRIAKQIMAARDRMIDGIGAIAGLHIVGKPELAVLSYSSDELDMFAVAERLGDKGWFVTPMSEPPGIHLGMLTLAHVPIVDEYLVDLAVAVEMVRTGELTASSRDVSYGG
jgi:glutamate/tyrosine decarboxylase-like PLP-dependent enzyme